MYIKALTANRFTLPNVETLVKECGTIELDLEMCSTDAEKQLLHDSLDSKKWRALRLAAKTKLSLFDKVDDGKKLDALLKHQSHGESTIEGGEVTTTSGQMEE